MRSPWLYRALLPEVFGKREKGRVDGIAPAPLPAQVPKNEEAVATPLPPAYHHHLLVSPGVPFFVTDARDPRGGPGEPAGGSREDEHWVRPLRNSRGGPPSNAGESAWEGA